MEKFILTEQAAADLDEIWEYIAESNLDAADQLMDDLYKAMQKLADIPGMGRTRLTLADERHRFWVVNPYLIVYRTDTQCSAAKITHQLTKAESLNQKYF